MKKISIFIMFFAFICITLSAQSAEKVTEMIEAKTVSLEDVAYFASTYLGISAEDAENAVALTALSSHANYSKIEKRADTLTYDDFAHFCTQTWNIKGGIMLRLTKAPRYAFRELQSMGLISTSVNPNSIITGLDALTIISQCIDYSVENETIDLGPTTIDFQSSFSR